MALTDSMFKAAAFSSCSDPRPCPCHCRRRRSRRRMSPRRTTTRGIDSTLVFSKLAKVAVVVFSVASLLVPFDLNLNNFNTLNLIVGVDAVVELTTSLGGWSVKSQPALFGMPFTPGESYRNYLFLPPGDDRDKFLCGTRNRDRGRGRRNLRRGRHVKDGNDDGERDLTQAERRKVMEETAGDLYRAVTGMEPPDISSLSSWGSMGDDEGRRISARGMPMRSLNGTEGGAGGFNNANVANVNATGNATQTTTQTNTTGTDSDSIPDPDPTNPDDPNNLPATSTGGSNPPAPGTPPADLPLALLVSRGGSSSESGSGGSCSFETKARNAMDLNVIFHMYIMGAENPMSDNHPLVRIESLIVHDYIDNTGDADRLVSMEATSHSHNDIDLRLVFVSTRSGIYLRRAVEEDAKARHAYASSGGSDGNTGAGSLAWRQNAYLSGTHFTSYRDRPESTWTLPPPPVVTMDGVGALPTSQSPQGGSQAENDNGGNNGNQQPSSSSSSSTSSSSTSSLSTFILYFLVSVIAAAAISRLMMLWLEGGGRIGFRCNPNTHRIVGLRVVSAERGWWRGAARTDLQEAGDGTEGGGQEGKDEHKMSTEEVMALPEIEYRGCADVDVEDPATAAGGSSSLLLSSGESGSLRRLSTSPRRISFSSRRGLFRTSSSPSFPAPAHRRGSAPSPCSAFPQASSSSSTMRHCSSALCLASFSSVAESPIGSSATIEGTAAAAATIAVADENSDDKEQAHQEEEEISSKTCCTTCSICIEDFERGEKIRLLPRCRHAFHTECILPWLTERQGCCPLCKTRVLLLEDADKEQHEDEDDEEQNQEEEGDIVVESSSEHEERAVELMELPRTSQVEAADDDSGTSIGICIEASAGDAESSENDGIFQGDATDDGTSDVP